MKIGIAVLGAGRWGVNLIRNFLEHPDSEVLAIVDPNPDSLAAVKKQFNFNENVILAGDWAQVQELPGLEAVAIATPASTHYTLTAAALKSGYHVLVEKPLALSNSEAIELCQLAEKQQRQLFVDHTYLFHPAVDRGQSIIQQHQLGKLRYGYAQRTHLEPVRHDVDALWDLAVHDIAIFNTWLEQTPIQVRAIGTVFQKEESPSTEFILSEVEALRERFRKKEEGIQNAVSPTIFGLNPLEGLADLVWVTLTYPDGFQAFIHLCWLNPDKQRRLTIVGSLGTLIFDEMSPEAPLILQRGNSDIAGDEKSLSCPITAQSTLIKSREVLSLEPVEPLRQVCDRFLNCIQTNTPCPTSSGSASVQLICILSALSKSLQLDGQIINVSP
ncbi:Gfo/Idh/MocA family protein [Tychonema sp. BBK16]|uniref:Gfo/Idh/MocA family protein n=1 Tax=Tychonema sp. BBK16 TaxID=2699888 RepID=UPI001F181010|nr:Gfo/Idh/MocA family oxidoreductase [Tychonema sp. BBK16]MCF6375968.1 Gfo/Idh/MocA family oxidoreductase [Tychonema sp. BBK16]